MQRKFLRVGMNPKIVREAAGVHGLRIVEQINTACTLLATDEQIAGFDRTYAQLRVSAMVYEAQREVDQLMPLVMARGGPEACSEVDPDLFSRAAEAIRRRDAMLLRSAQLQRP